MITILSDIERKTLRILYNFTIRWDRPPTIEEMEIKTGRNRNDIYNAMSTLNEERYIEWDQTQPKKIVILEGWERQPLYKFEPASYNYKNSPFMD